MREATPIRTWPRRRIAGPAVAAVAAVSLLALGLGSPASAILPAAAPVGPAGDVLPPLSDAGPRPNADAVAAALEGPLSDPALGGSVGAVVIDVATGTVVYAQDAATPRSAASTQKVLTAVAVLDALGPEHRIATTASWDPATSTITLVGAGDPSLSSVAAEGSSLAALVDEVAANVPPGAVSLVYDTTLFDGPELAPSWPSSYPAAGVAAPVTALIVDRARIAGSEQREEDPALIAAQMFAGMLAERGFTVNDVRPGLTSGQVVASTESFPLAAIVAQMLTDSDNDASEMLAHLAGAARTGTGSFQTGAQATLATLDALGLDTAGMDVVDGSGLSYEDTVSPQLMASLLALLADESSPEWGWPVVLGLPVAGLTGTLDDRFLTADTFVGAGRVRAKTGTLDGVAALSGTVVDADGQLLVFALMSDAATDVYAARDALDRAAASLAACGCT